MRRLLLPLAALAAFVPSAASAQMFTAEQKEQANCIAATVLPPERDEIEIYQFGDDSEAAAAEAGAFEALDAATATCAARYGWQGERKAAAREYALSDFAYGTVASGVSEDLANRLDSLMASFDGAYIETFTYQGQEAVADPEGWRKGVEQRLLAAGIGAPDHGMAVAYLNSLADLVGASIDWQYLFEQGIE